MTIRYRRNIDCIGGDPLHDLREALQRMYDLPEDHPESFATLGGIHGDPAPTWCDHGSPGFLTWHRAYLLAFESALRANGCTTALPYWDWSSGPSTGVPAACSEPTYVDRTGDTVPNPLYAGPIASAAGGGTTARRVDIDTTSFGDIAQAAQAAVGSGSFGGFQSAINGPHGSVHVRVGGDMSSVSHAGFDPLFFLHHCNVDRLWWQWQQDHAWVLMPGDELDHPLDPFPRPFDDEWLTGSDVLGATSLGYAYSNWCFSIPPIIVWQLVPLDLPLPLPRLLRSARLVVRRSTMPPESVELRVFLGDEDAVRDDATDRNPAFAGTVGLFGMGRSGQRDHGAESTHASQAEGVVRGTFDVALDLTEHVRSRCGGSAWPGASLGQHAADGDEERSGTRDGLPHVAGGRGGHDGHHGRTERFALRVAAYDADGRPLGADRAPVDSIALEID